MSRYQTGHILGAFPVRFYQTESRDGQVMRVRRSHRRCAKDTKHCSEKSKPVSRSGPVGRFSTKRRGLACPRKLARQDLLERPLNPIDFFADHSDRLLIFQGVGHRSDSLHSASYLVIPSPNEVEPCASLLAMSVNATAELSGEPGKYQTKQHLNRNTVGCAVKL